MLIISLHFEIPAISSILCVCFVLEELRHISLAHIQLPYIFIETNFAIAKMSADMRTRNEAAEQIIQLHKIYTGENFEANILAKTNAASAQIEILFRKFSDAHNALLRNDVSGGHGLHEAIEEIVRQRYYASQVALQNPVSDKKRRKYRIFHILAKLF